MTMNISLVESKFLLNLNHDQISIIIDALIDKGSSEKFDPYAKQILTLADEMQKSLAAGLEERSKSYAATQIKTRLEALED
jgi:hypothetical protein